MTVFAFFLQNTQTSQLNKPILSILYLFECISHSRQSKYSNENSSILPFLTICAKFSDLSSANVCRLETNMNINGNETVHRDCLVDRLGIYLHTAEYCYVLRPLSHQYCSDLVITQLNLIIRRLETVRQLLCSWQCGMLLQLFMMANFIINMINMVFFCC